MLEQGCCHGNQECSCQENDAAFEMFFN